MKAVFFDAGFIGLEKYFGHQWLNVVINLDRVFSQPEIESAASRTMESFPILQCKYVKGALFDHWLPDPALTSSSIAAVEKLEGSLEEATLDFIHEPMDPERAPAWRVKLLASGNSSRLIIKVLHAMADGAGALTIVREFGSYLTGQKQESSPIAMNRGMWQVLRAVRLQDIPALLWESLGELVRPLVIPFITPEQLPPAKAEAEMREQYLELVIAGEEFLALKERCSRLNCTVNDALLAALAEVVKESTEREIICILFTADLRKYLPAKRPVVGNLSGGNILALRRSRLSGLEQTARMVAQKTGELKSRIPGLQLILFQLFSYGLLPHSIIRAATSQVAKYFDQVIRRTLLFTNIGPMDEYLAPYGKMARSACVIGPCFRQLTSPVFVATGFRDSLTIQACSWNDLPLEKVDRLNRLLRRQLLGG